MSCSNPGFNNKGFAFQHDKNSTKKKTVDKKALNLTPPKQIPGDLEPIYNDPDHPAPSHLRRAIFGTISVSKNADGGPTKFVPPDRGRGVLFL